MNRCDEIPAESLNYAEVDIKNVLYKICIEIYLKGKLLCSTDLKKERNTKITKKENLANDRFEFRKNIGIRETIFTLRAFDIVKEHKKVLCLFSYD
ncbi:Retrovirus-related Pol polyprotein LINE-1 [Aphis craccivora]|uniref:Retrovirus-related Pol polyprotein LINE-1 n=1 Tax=Aphis craccivora TaxID=307492 RepID=A0A6G0YVE9_APHCR|nr:Retrovirus-related Pol polyprotein LINE-1 [Aphis craccivora]